MQWKIAHPERLVTVRAVGSDQQNAPPQLPLAQCITEGTLESRAAISAGEAWHGNTSPRGSLRESLLGAEPPMETRSEGSFPEEDRGRRNRRHGEGITSFPPTRPKPRAASVTHYGE